MALVQLIVKHVQLVAKEEVTTSVHQGNLKVEPCVMARACPIRSNALSVTHVGAANRSKLLVLKLKTQCVSAKQVSRAPRPQLTATPILVQTS